MGPAARIQAQVNKELIENDNIDSTLSGTTALTLIIDNDRAILSNVGDSKCIVGLLQNEKVALAKTLNNPHTLDREDERQRVENAGGVINTVSERNNNATVSKHETKREWMPGDGMRDFACFCLQTTQFSPSSGAA